MIIDRINQSNINYISNVSKNIRKKMGQFFTPPSISNFMGGLMECSSSSIRILDAGAGSGILTGALCEKLLSNKNVNDIYVDLYENNEDIIPLLKANMEFIKDLMQERGKVFNYQIIIKNFILNNADFWDNKEEKTEKQLYDVIICNPPYKKIGKNDMEAVLMKSIVYGQPNIYFLFMAMGTKLLKQEGQMIYITPRSFTSGAYFKKFRQWFLRNVQLSHIHLFHSRGDVFNTESVLQETVILKAVKTKKNINMVTITTSSDATFNDIETFEVSKDTVVDRNTDNLYILIPTSEQEIEIISLINNWTYTMPDLGFKLSTGKVVDFRATEFLESKQNNNTVPLFWACNFSNNKITHIVNELKCPQFIRNSEESKSLLIENKNYIFVKRFTSKEEPKRIQCAIYFANQFTEHEKIGVENHLNYITKLDGSFTNEELYGLFALLNSSYLDRYYRILNGSTQVNATEMNSIPFPDIDTIKEIGLKIIKANDVSVEFCDSIIKELFIDNNIIVKNVV